SPEGAGRAYLRVRPCGQSPQRSRHLLAGTLCLAGRPPGEGSMIGTLKTVVFDARDIAGLSAFYRALAGWTQVYADDEWITLTTGDGWRIGLQAAPDHVPPRWPDPAYPQQAHLDLRVPDIDAATTRAVELGATLLRANPAWHTLADPAGHPFDLCRGPDGGGTTVRAVTLACPAASGLRAFYSELLGTPACHPAADPAGHPCDLCPGPDAGATAVRAVARDCPEPSGLSAFYAELLGKPVPYQGDGMAMIGEEGQQPLLFQQVAPYTPPRW